MSAEKTTLENAQPALSKTAVSSSFYFLIDRLQKHSEWKYPERIWTNDFYYECAFQWKGKEKELEERVLKLENDMRLAGAL
jgi:hypothetical protein